MRLYAEYLAEREGFDMVYNGHLFISYKIVDEEIIIKDMFIRKKFRDQGLMYTAVNKLIDEAKAKGCKYLSGFVQLWDPNKDQSLMAYLKFGCKIYKVEGQTIYIGKEI